MRPWSENKRYILSYIFKFKTSNIIFIIYLLTNIILIDFRCKDNDSLVYVELKYCLQSLNVTPSSVERCHVDCQTPCQMTEWSHWSSCPQPCSGLRTRTRELIGDSLSHPACKEVRLVETTKCPCSEYFPQPTSDWSFCLTNETDGCGAGTRYRSLGCYNVNNHLVDPA